MLSEAAPLRVGVVGCGRVAWKRHLPVLKRLPGVEVVGVVDLDAERARRTAAAFGISRWHQDARALLEHPSLDVVAVCVPAQSHAEIAVAALDSGRSVLIEKPLATTLEDCDRILESASRSPGKAAVGFHLRSHRLLREARRLVEQDVLGRVEVIRSVHTGFQDELPEWRKRRATGGGVLFEQAVHHFDAWRVLPGTEVTRVFATTRSCTSEDQSAAVTAWLASGVVACGAFSQRTASSSDIEIYGTKGVLQLSFYRFDGLRFEPCSAVSGSLGSRLEDLWRFTKALPRGIVETRHGGIYQSSFFDEWRHFLGVVRSGGDVRCTVSDGKRAVEIALAAIQSASLGKPIELAGEAHA